MNNLSQYIIEKFKISKNINLENTDFKTFDNWKKYLEENDLKIFQYRSTGGVYAIYLKNSDYKIKDLDKVWNGKFTTPYIDIEVVDDKHWIFYSLENGKIEINIDSEDFKEMESIPEPKDLDTDIDKEEAIKNHTSFGYSFTKKNADFIIETLNKMYDISK